MGMNQIIELTVDIQDGITHSYKEFSQNNLNNSELILNIADGGKEFSLEEKDKIIVYFQKPDKQFVFQDKDIVVLDKTKGKIKVLLTAQTIVVPGTVYGEISIERVEGGVKKRTSTYSFTFRVRPSLASNEVIESTNEYGVIQKAIEVGEKFKDVEFDPIIAAGELAKGALPKTGGTMTGNFNFQTKDGAKMLQWYNDQTQLGRLVFHPSGLVEWFGRNGATETGAWNYSPATNTFNVVSNTNLLKKSEVYYDYLQPTGNTKVLAAGTDLNTVQATGCYAGSGLLNAPEGLGNFMYIEVLRYHDVKYVKQTATTLTGSNSSRIFTRRKVADVWEAWTETIQSTGGTVKGQLHIEMENTGDRRLAWLKDGNLLWGLTSSQSAVTLFDWKNNRNVWSYDATANTFNLNTANSNLVKSSGDTMTGHLNMNSNSQIIYNQLSSTTSAKGFMYTDDTSTAVIGGIGRFRTTTGESYYMGWGASPWSAATSLTVSNAQFTYKNFKITTAEKDGRVNLTLTADGSNPDANYPLTATRRGNTVTVSGSVMLNSATTGATISNLPVDMRPVGNVNMYTPVKSTTSGDVMQVFINATSGALALYGARGKAVDFVMTYTVN